MTTHRDDAAHRLDLRVYYEDTDLGGVVYYANYLKFMERGRTEWLRDLGVDQRRLKQDTGLVFVVRRCTVDYRRPALMDDQISVFTSLLRRRGASLELAQRVVLKERPGDELTSAQLLTEATVTVACIDASGRPARLPAALAERLVEPQAEG